MNLLDKWKRVTELVPRVPSNFKLCGSFGVNTGYVGSSSSQWGCSPTSATECIAVGQPQEHRSGLIHKVNISAPVLDGRVPDLL